MGIAEQIADFFSTTGQSVFIEVEAKGSKIESFIREYNLKYPPISADSEGVIVLDKNANKWGLELRCYFSNRNGFPAEVQVTSTTTYRSIYPYRFNDVRVIKNLFELGYRIGRN